MNYKENNLKTLRKKVIKKASFEPGRRKTYSDLMINWIKEKGVINTWKEYCKENGKYTLLY